MTSISVAYRHSGHFRPLFLKNPAIEETASAVRAQLVAEDTDRLPISTLREISRLNVNGLCFDLWVSLDHPVTDHETGEQVCGLCEFDPGAGEDAVSLLVSPVGEGMTEELVLSTFGHELGHAVFDAPGWIADSKVSPGLFDTPDQQQRKAYRTTTHDIGHLTSPGVSPPHDEGLLARIVEAERERKSGSRNSRQRIHGITAGAPPTVGRSVIEMAPKYDVTLVACPGLLEDEAPTTFTIKTDGPFGDFDLENLQKAIGKRFGVHGRFIKVRMARYGCCREPPVEVVVRISGLRLPATSRRFLSSNVARSRNAQHEGDVMVAVTEQQQEAQEESPKADSGATAITSEDGVKQASADHGPDLLPDMEHFVWLVRKIKNIPLLRRLLRNEGVHMPEKTRRENGEGERRPASDRAKVPVPAGGRSITGDAATVGADRRTHRNPRRRVWQASRAVLVR
jgi:hypothetical protein